MMPMIDFLHTLPVWAAGAILSSLSIGCGLLFVELVTRLVPHASRVAGNEVGGFMIAVVGTVYAVPLALIAAAAWGDYVDARSTVQREAAVVGRFMELIESLPEAPADVLRAALHNYVGTVIGQEWPEMAHGRIPAAAGLKAVQLRDVVAAEVEAATCRRRAASRASDHLGRLEDARLDRLLCVSDGLIPAIWMLILVDTTMLAFGALLRDRERRHAPTSRC